MPFKTLLPLLIVFIGVMVAVFALWMFISRILGKRREKLQQRIEGSPDSDPALSLDALVGVEKRAGWFSAIDERFDRLISGTGLDMDPRVALGVVFVSGAVAALLVFVWRFLEDRFYEEAWLALPAFLIGATIPILFYAWRVRVWRRNIRNQLPDTFYLLARSLRAGRSTDQAIQLVAEQGVPPLSREFARIHRQLELGLAMGPAVRNTAVRLNLVDFNVFASIVSLHRSTGGNLPVILDRLAAATREHNQFEGQYRAATVLGRYSAALISALAVLILINLMFYQREWFARFFESGQGIALFIIALALEAAGALSLLWIVKQE